MDEGRPVSAKQWEALAVVVRRGDDQKPALIVKSPKGDAAIGQRQAAALFQRGLINITGSGAWPTPAGRSALAVHERIKSRRNR